MGWVPTTLPPGAMPTMNPPQITTPTGWDPSPYGTLRTRTWLCLRFIWSGHLFAECPGAPGQMHAAISCAAPQYRSLMYYGGGRLQETPYGSDTYTSDGAWPPQPSSSLSPFPGSANTCTGTCTFGPNLLTLSSRTKTGLGNDSFRDIVREK